MSFSRFFFLLETYKGPLKSVCLTDKVKLAHSIHVYLTDHKPAHMVPRMFLAHKISRVTETLNFKILMGYRQECSHITRKV